MRAFEKRQTFNPKKAKFRTWMNVLTKYQALDFLRSQPSVYDGEINDYLEFRAQQMERQDDLVEDNRLDLIKDAIVKMEDHDAQILKDHYFNGVSQAELATRLGIEENTMKQRLSRARNRLRKIA